MGMTTGTVTHGGSPAGGVTVQFVSGGSPKANAATDSLGRYAIYLPAATYSANVGGAPCSPATFPIPAGTKIQNLSY